MSGFENDVMLAKNLNFDEAGAKPHLGIINAAGKFPIGTGLTQPSIEILAGKITSPLGTLSVGYSSPNITVDVTGGAPYISLSPYIVGSDIHSGYSTIQAGINAAVGAGASTSTPLNVYIKPGTYTENLTLADGVNLIGFGSFYYDGASTIINGTCTATFSGACALQDILLKTNGSNSLIVSGGNSTRVNLINCFLNVTSTVSIAMSSSGAPLVYLFNCNGLLNNAGATYFTLSTSGVIRFFGGLYQNFGSSTPSTISNASDATFINVGFFGSAVTGSSTGAIVAFNSSMQGALIVNGTSGADTISGSVVSGGTASAISIGAGATCIVANTSIYSSNTNAITGAGILKYALISFLSSSSTVNTSTQTPLATLL